MHQRLRMTQTQLKSVSIFLAGLLFFSLASNAKEVSEKKDMEVLQVSEQKTVSAQAEAAVSEVEIEPQSGSSITVFVGAKFGRKQKGAAKALTKSHAKYFQNGYHFTDLGVYTENGDLEGFFVTYTKK